MNYEKIAKIIVETNLELKRKDMVIISAGPRSLQFAEALSFECVKIGAQPTIIYGSDKLSLKTYKIIKNEYLKDWPKLSDFLTRKADAKIIIDEGNPFIEKRLPQNKIEIRRKTLKPLDKISYKRTMQKTYKLVLVGFPTKEDAKAMKIPFAKLQKIYFDTMNVNYKKLYEYTKRLADKLLNKDKIHITGERTDLTLSIKKRKPLIDCGVMSKETISYLNLPTGEVFFAPNEHSANGEIYFDLPCLWHYGKQVKGVWFKFKNGNVVDYEIEKGLRNFEDVIKNASGEKLRIAELGIGTNPSARFTGGMTIIDEKIRGTIHIAIGQNKHFGGRNDATIHWDFFKGMKHGALEADGRFIMKKGKLLI